MKLPMNYCFNLPNKAITLSSIPLQLVTTLHEQLVMHVMQLHSYTSGICIDYIYTYTHNAYSYTLCQLHNSDYLEKCPRNVAIASYYVNRFPATYPYNVKEWFSSPANSSINKINAIHKFTGLLLLRLFSGAHQTFTSSYIGVH